MTDRERHQANLLDGFIDNLDGSHLTPPDDLDPALASVAVVLAAELTPPDPSASFISRLGQGLTATSAEATNHQQAVLPPASEAELTATSAPPDWRATALPPRRSRLSELARLAAAGLAIMLIGSLLIFMFSEQEEIAGPGIGVGPPAAGEILVSWDPAGEENFKLYIIDASGEFEPRKLTRGPHEDDGVTERFASWSPDGQQIAFVREDGNVRDIVVINADGSDMVNLTSSPASDTQPVWSPDGLRIVYTSSVEGEIVANIHVMNADGSNTQQVTEHPNGATHPVWSPDGSQIAFLTRAMDSQRLWVMDADGTNQQEILSQAAFIYRPAWSPDGQRLAFRDGSTIWVTEVDVPSKRNVSEATGATTEPVWSTDSSRILYASGKAGSGSGDITIAAIDGTILDRWTPEVDTLGALSWSPDNRRIAYYSGIDRNEGQGAFWDFVWELHITAPGGDGKRTILEGGIDYNWPPAWSPDVSADTPAPNPTPSPAPETGTEIELPANLAHQNHTAETVSMLPVSHEPLMTQDEAMATLAGEFSWALGGQWQDREITVDAWYGLATIGDDIRDQEIWLLDYGDLHGINGRVDCTNCSPLIGYNHNAYAIDARTGELIWSAAYREGLVEGEPPPAWLTYGEQAQLGVLSGTCFWPGGWGGCADSAGVFFPDDVLEVPQGSELAFSLEGMTGDDLLQPWAQAWPLDDDAEVEQLQGKQFLVYTGQPSVSLPTSWSPTSMEITADLPPGEYVIQVDIRLPSDVDPPVNGQATTSGGSATIGFHVHVLEDGDQGSTSLPETGSGFQNQDQGFGDRSAHSFPSTPHSCHGRSSAGTVRCMDCQPNCGAHAVMFIA